MVNAALLRSAAIATLLALAGAPPQASAQTVNGESAWPPDNLAHLPEVAVIPSDHLVVVKIGHPLDTENPFATEWWDAPYVEVDVFPQQMARPMLEEASIKTIRVQALTDGEQIAWRVSWPDPTPDGNVDVSRFSDGVAVEFPLDEGALPMMGDEESRLIEPAIRVAREAGIDASGPFPADTVFIKAAAGEFDLVVAMYHDQGLTPVKLLGWDKAVNWTLGLPFIRTSPDHGTAFDIAGRDKASEGSMKAAMEHAARLAAKEIAAAQAIADPADPSVRTKA